ncbi:hypothetical protein ASF33_00005 [Methylobacterium sp. Leaf92]|nr:hypothetical protein ASF33_00005 [Methylobacterium sp. Leaf92]
MGATASVEAVGKEGCAGRASVRPGIWPFATSPASVSTSACSLAAGMNSFDREAMKRGGICPKRQ